MAAMDFTVGKAILLFVGAGCAVSPARCTLAAARPDFELKSVPGILKFQSEKAWASEIVDGRYRLFNNVWNSKAIAGPYRQQVFVKDDRGRPIVGWVWSVQESQAPATYPEIQAGFSPWNGAVAPNSGFPFQAGTRKLMVNFDITIAATGTYDVALQSWVVSASRPTSSTITHEIVILVANQGMPVPGSLVARATVQDHGFAVYVDKNRRDAAGKNINSWTLMTLVADKPILRGPFDMGEVIHFLLRGGYLDGKSTIANVELGTDIMRGAGSAVVRDFAVTVE